MNEASNDLEIFTCNTCGETKPISDKSAVKGSHCKACMAQKKREQRAKIKQEKPIEVDISEENIEGEVKPEKKPAPKKKTRPIKKKVDPIIENSITVGIVTLTNVISVRAGEHWAFTQQESEEISKNLCSVLNRFGIFKNINQNSDIVGLVLALGTSLAPRIITTIHEKGGNKKNDKKGKIVDIDRGNMEGKAKPNSSNVTRSNKDILFSTEF